MFGSQGLLPAWKFVCSLVVVITQVHKASFLRMITEGQQWIRNAGDSVEVPCEFYTDQFSMFDNPIIWTKYQHSEETPVNIMGNILEPLLSTNRLKVTLVSRDAPRYQMTLRFEGLVAEDSGNYTCEVRGQRSTVLAIVEHSVSVRSSVDRITIEVGNSSSPLPSADVYWLDGFEPSGEYTDNRAVFIEARPRQIRCVSEGGFPLPEMRLYVGEREVTKMFSQSNSVTLDGERGLRQIHYRIERSTSYLSFSALDDEQPIRCVVTVSGFPANQTHLIVNVIHKPLIKCPEASAYVGERSVALRCEVRARPPLTALFWIIDGNGTTIQEGKVISKYWTLVMDRSDGMMETKLFIEEVIQQSFRSYTVMAENNIASATAHVRLNQVERSKMYDSKSPVGLQADRPGSQSQTRNSVRKSPEYVLIRSTVSSRATVVYNLTGSRSGRTRLILIHLMTSSLILLRTSTHLVDFLT